MPAVLGQVLRGPSDASTQLLAAAAHPYLAGQGLFSDPQAARMPPVSRDGTSTDCWSSCGPRAASSSNWMANRFCSRHRRTGATRPSRRVSRAASDYLPAGVRLAFPEHYAAVYARAPRSTILLGRDGAVTLVGSGFRASRLEPYGEAFMQRIAPMALRGDAVGLRQAFLETVHLLRTTQVPLHDLCVLVTLHKSPAQYRRSGLRKSRMKCLAERWGPVVASGPPDSLLSHARRRAAAAARRRGRHGRRRGCGVLRAAPGHGLLSAICAGLPSRRFRQDFRPTPQIPVSPRHPRSKPIWRGAANRRGCTVGGAQRRFAGMHV